MKRFTTRIIICLLPTLLSIGIIGWAYNEYSQGRGGIVLGVDLVGGTTLIYEVDESKMTPEALAAFKIEDLASALKRRIDPADLYNITVRGLPGSPPRVEIVLPTGGKHQEDVEARHWQELLAKAETEFPVKGDPQPYADLEKDEGSRGELVDLIAKSKRPEIEAWVKEQLEPAKGKAIQWKEVLVAAAGKFRPEGRENAYTGIPEGDRAALIARIAEVERSKIDAWVESKTASKGGKNKKMLTGDEVENIKNLVSRQGRLEFRIIANSTDDAEAMRAATEALKRMSKEELARFEQKNEPPTGPREASGNAFFAVTLPDESNHSYSWVELGKDFLWEQGLNGLALKQTGSRYRMLVEQAEKTGEPFSIDLSAGQRGLVYVRPITDWSRRLIKDKQQEKAREFFILVRDPIKGKEITGDYLVRTQQGMDSSGKRTIDFTFNAEGGELFYDVTSKNRPTGGESGIKRQLAIIFDGQIESAPALQSPIRTNGQITGEFTQEKIDFQLRVLRAGALPATLKKDPVSEDSTGPTLGAETIKWGFWSVIGAYIAVMAFMIFYYRTAGVVACIALFANLLLTVAFMVLVQAAFTLPGLAGLVLMLGMAVDANVLIYERLREERERGASLALAVRNGYDRAFPTIIDTHLSSIFTAIVLYVVGNDQLKGFGISLTVGLIISLFTSLYQTRTIFEIMLARGVKDLNFFGGLVKLIHARYWDFMSIRQYWFTATIILTVLGAALFIYRADPKSERATVLNIDFTGGTAFTGRLDKPMFMKDLREELQKDNPLPDLSIQQIGKLTEDGQTEYFEIRTSERDAPKVLEFISTRLADKLKKLTVEEKFDIKAVGPNATAATLTFQDGDQPGYASVAQVQRVLSDEFTRLGKSPSSFTVDRPADRKLKKDGRYSQLSLKLNDPIPEKQLREILNATRAKFANSPQPERLSVFDSQLAGDTQRRALYAILASWAAILAYLWFRFGSWTFGAAAVVCLLHDLFFTLGVIAACHYVYEYTPWLATILGLRDFKIDLSTVAALLTLVGYSVNDTIVVFDRIREVRGKNPLLTAQIINDSVNQTLTRTILASSTVFVVVLVLYVLGGEGVKLFAFVMIVGVVVGTYSSIYIASPLLLIFGEGRPASPAALDRAPATANRD